MFTRDNKTFEINFSNIFYMAVFQDWAVKQNLVMSGPVVPPDNYLTIDKLLLVFCFVLLLFLSSEIQDTIEAGGTH